MPQRLANVFGHQGRMSQSVPYQLLQIVRTVHSPSGLVESQIHDLSCFGCRWERATPVRCLLLFARIGTLSSSRMQSRQWCSRQVLLRRWQVHSSSRIYSSGHHAQISTKIGFVVQNTRSRCVSCRKNSLSQCMSRGLSTGF